MVNVLIITPVFYPQISGITTRLKKLITLLEPHGYNFTIMTPLTTAQYKQIEYLSSFKYPSWFTGIENNEIMISKFYRYNQIYQEISSTVIKYQIDMIHVISPLLCGYIVNRVAQRHQIKCVHSYHTDVIQYLETNGANWAFKYFSRIMLYYLTGINSADQVAAPSINTLVAIYEQGISKNLHSLVIPEFLPLEPRPEFFHRQPDKNLVYVGRVAPEKSLERIITAMNQLPDYTLHIVGYGSSFSAMQLLAANQPNIIFYGAIAHSDISNYYLKGSIFIQTSETETRGLTTIEAMICGLVPIVYPAGGSLEIVSDRINGLYFKTKEELTAAIRSVPESWNTLRNGCRNYLNTKFSEHENLRFWTDFYRI